jgi:hypothetical protein
MVALLRTRITLVWFVLVAATAFSWEMGHGVVFDDVRYASVVIIVVAFIKVRFVLLDFMEVRHAPLFMRLIGTVWLVAVCTTLVVLYWHSAIKVI